MVRIAFRNFGWCVTFPAGQPYGFTGRTKESSAKTKIRLQSEYTMRSSAWKLTFGSGLLFAGLMTAVAGPLQREDVIKDPAWILHVDVEALRGTIIGRHLLSASEQPEVQKKLAAFQTITGIDPHKSVHGFTLYGPTAEANDGLLLVYADFDPERLATLAGGGTDHKTVGHHQHTIHHWIEEKKPAKDGVKPRTYTAIHGGKIIVFGQQQNRVADALDVLDRVKPNLTLSTDYASLSLGDGSAFIQGAARKLEVPASDPNAAILRQSKMLWLSLGEPRQRVEAALTMAADSEEVAQQIEAIGRGLMGLLALQTDKPESVKLAQALSIQQAGTSVTVKLSLPAAEVVGMIKAKSAK